MHPDFAKSENALVAGSCFLVFVDKCGLELAAELERLREAT